MKRRSFLSRLLGIPLLSPLIGLVPACEEPKRFWAGTTIPRSDPIGYQYSYYFVNSADERVTACSGVNDWTSNGQA
jgi:hypothetical protein